MDLEFTMNQLGSDCEKKEKIIPAESFSADEKFEQPQPYVNRTRWDSFYYQDQILSKQPDAGANGKSTELKSLRSNSDKYESLIFTVNVDSESSSDEEDFESESESSHSLEKKSNDDKFESISVDSDEKTMEEQWREFDGKESWGFSADQENSGEPHDDYDAQQAGHSKSVEDASVAYRNYLDSSSARARDQLENDEMVFNLLKNLELRSGSN